jgi:hypothetical protein
MISTEFPVSINTLLTLRLDPSVVGFIFNANTKASSSGKRVKPKSTLEKAMGVSNLEKCFSILKTFPLLRSSVYLRHFRLESPPEAILSEIMWMVGVFSWI